MKDFDWEFAERERNPNVVAWLRANHAMEVSEDRFINEVSLIYRQDRAAGKYKHLNWKKYNKNSPSHQRRMYRKLKNGFGFFHG